MLQPRCGPLFPHRLTRLSHFGRNVRKVRIIAIIPHKMVSQLASCTVDYDGIRICIDKLHTLVLRLNIKGEHTNSDRRTSELLVWV